MLVKDLLSKYSGKFYIYEYTYDEHENLINKSFVASHKDFKGEDKYTIKKIGERKIDRYEAEASFLNIYLVCKRKSTDNIMDEHVEFLELPTRITHALFRVKINTIQELCDKTRLDVLMIRTIGKNSLKEIEEALEVYELYLKEDED